MVEEDPVAGENSVSFAVVYGVPMGGDFGGGVRGSGVEGGGFGLRGWGGSEHFGRSRLVVFDVGATGGGNVGSDGFEEAEGTGGNDVSGVIRDFEGNGDV